ncbi:10864_t:CDS:2, partial [Diversispora eburnea]
CSTILSTQDLFSSSLVNRFWCEVTVPILWGLPFCQTEYTNNSRLEKKALCIRTYISCLDVQARTLLSQNGFDLSSSPPQATFDYPSFTHKFIINNLVNYIYIYSHQIDDLYDYYDRMSIPKSKILFSEICKLIINRCAFLDEFKLVEVPKKFFEKFRNYSDLIGSILHLPGAREVFKSLESFTSIIRNYENYDLIYPLYGLLKFICNNILNMDLSLVSIPQAQLLKELISVQKRLENLSIVIVDVSLFQFQLPNLFWVIVSKNQTLKSLHLKSVLFDFERESLEIVTGQFILLQELYIDDCYGLDNFQCLSLASSFTQLTIFHYIHSHKNYAQSFIIKILEMANTNLRNIYLKLQTIISKDILSAIFNFSTKVIKLTLYNLRKNYYADKLLKQMARNLPHSLETIMIKIDHKDPWEFSADSLRKLFEELYYNERGGNKKIIIKCEEGALILSNDHYEVLEEYENCGVEFNLIWI